MRAELDTVPHDLDGYAKRERRMAKKLLVCSGGFIGLIVLGILYWNWSAAREWQRLKADLEAKGETFDLQRLLPPAPDDESNYGAIAPLKDMALVVDDDESKGDPGIKRSAFRDLTVPSDQRPSFYSGIRAGVPVDLAAWAATYRNSGLLPMPNPSVDPASDLIAALDAALPAVTDLCKAAGFPESQFTPPFHQRKWPTLLATVKEPHLNAVQNTAIALRLRAVAAAGMRDGRIATESILAMLMLAEAAGQEPFLNAHVVSITITTMAHASLWEGLRIKAFTAEQLTAIQSRLELYDGRSRLLYALRTDATWFVNLLDQLKATKTLRKCPASSSGPTESPGYMPDVWYDSTLTKQVSLQWEYCIEPLNALGLEAAVTKSATLDIPLSAMKENPLRAWAFSLVHERMPTIARVISRSAYVQSVNDLAVAAVALESYSLKHQSYPSELDELTPDILPRKPLDHMNGKPVLYKRTNDGEFVLWTLGFDGRDDHGVTFVGSSASSNQSSLSQFDYKGDWVWQYTPVKP